MMSKTSRDVPGPKPRNDEKRETQEAIIADISETDAEDRDLIQGEGRSIDLHKDPRDLSKDD
ncbi:MULTISPECIES: hypothetical protein [unclassified Bradyrhizobium]|uniref:hypothetical protein n=1 Tax=unclassified Bradyrhizobium TaxID=2631580 RepID=UPI00247844FB|nr:MULTISPECIES: hypothetical protein [unclassified Bradyrhizobium]WGR73691.1 hypothetical protein MTX24_13095 [Bradyrhizobium sp. ISRA426]WGR78529.1 hypothetical protein MTX21_38065 [Bradyrhizobium sp. ISRA430]WGR88930.1 hypothetical protein MTX25_13110 [Bradyrhizobium sp. ISRA432]